MRRRLLAALGTCVAAGAVAAPSADAHAYLLATSPPNEAVVPTEPAAVRLVFSEAVDLGPNAIQLLRANGDRVPTGSARRVPGRPNAVALPLPPGLLDGTYAIAWRVVGSDSHAVSGGFSFSIGAPSAVVSAPSRHASRVVPVADAVARGVAFLGLAVTVGGACLLLFLWPEGRSSRRGRLLVWGGVGALLAGTTLALLLQGPYAAGASATRLLSPSLLDFSVSTRFGHALLARLVLTGVIAVLIALALARRIRGPAPAVGLAACAVGLAATWTLGDHSRTGVEPWLGIPVASVHLLAMALWLGGLAVLLACALGPAREEQGSLAVALPRFSRLGLACFAALGVTGVYLAWRQVGTLPALPATSFGRLLLVKSGIVLAIVGLAALSRRTLARHGGLRGLRRSVAGEALLGVCVLSVTAILVNAVPARVSYKPPVDETVRAAGGKVEVQVHPARVGANEADVYVTAPDGTLAADADVTGRLEPPDPAARPVPLGLGAAEPGHYLSSELSVPFTGRWTMRLRISGPDGATTVRVPVRIR